MRASKLDTTPGLIDEVARLHAEGASQQTIADFAGVSDRGTVAEWLKREDVQLRVSKLLQDRANRILRHTDTKIEKKLEADGDDKMSLERLLKIRQTFAGQQVNVDMGGDKAAVLEDFIREMHENPDLAAAASKALADDDTD